MPVAFTLINSKVEDIEEILHDILQLEEVEEAYSVTGPYSILAKVEAEKFEMIADVIPEKLLKIDGIEDTTTLVAFGVSKEFREKACEEAKQLSEKNNIEELYELCRNCEQANYCAYGARVITYGF